MRLTALGRMGLGAARYRLTGRRLPLTAYLAVTNQCDALCTHCAIPMRTGKELTTRELLELVDQLAAKGTQVVVITGGEPLLRDDIGDVVARCAARDLFVRIETNGYRWVDRADALGGLGQLAVSYEGRREVHDEIREPGSWDRAVDAIVDARKRGIPVTTLTTITRHNHEALDDVLRFAEQNRHTAEFRLLVHNETLDGGASRDLAPSDADTRRAIRKLIEHRRNGRPVATTEKTLRTLLSWQDYSRPTSLLPREDQVCLAGHTHAFVDADGTLHPCRQRVGIDRPVSVREGFGPAWEKLRQNDCQACASADLCERNHLDNFNLPAVLGLLRNLRPQTSG